MRSDVDLISFIRRAAETDYHPLGTCCMGIEPDTAADPSFRVRDVENPGVRESSIMPTLVSGNAASIMIGESGTDLIAGERIEMGDRRKRLQRRRSDQRARNPARPPAAPAALSHRVQTDQFDLVAVGILDEGDVGDPVFHGAGLAGNLAAPRSSSAAQTA